MCEHVRVCEYQLRETIVYKQEKAASRIVFVLFGAMKNDLDKTIVYTQGATVGASLMYEEKDQRYGMQLVADPYCLTAEITK